MKVYIKFFTIIFFRSLFFVFLVMTSLVIILNLLSELEFFKDENVSLIFTIFLSILNSPSLIFEMFPFILLITVQLFFIKLFENKEIEIFKYSGLKNSKIILTLSILSVVTGVLVSSIFYNFSSDLKNFYLELKSKYTIDGKYLAVITKNGLWIKDKIDNKIIITNSSSIENNFLINNFITEFDESFNVIRNIQSEKINIIENNWKILNPNIYEKNNYISEPYLNLQTNFDLEKIQNLFSNLSALNYFELFELRKNYKKLNYSTIDVELHIFKLFSFPFFLFLISLFSALIMLNFKNIKSSSLKISIGLFFSVLIYYFNNFAYVLGSTEKISVILSIVLPLITLGIINIFMMYNLNEK